MRHPSRFVAFLAAALGAACQSPQPTMTKKTISTQDAPKAIGPYSQAVELDRWVYCSGQIALDPASGQLVAGDVRQQTERVLQNLKAVLQAAGCGVGDVVKTTVFLADLNDFVAMNEVYGATFSSNPPARSTIQAAKLPRGALVEIDAVARKPK